MPALCVADDYFLPDTIITCDSTTQTRGPVFGNFLVFNDKSQTLDIVNPKRGINPNSLKMCRIQWNYAKPYFKKHQQEYNLIPKNADDFRNHYTEYADNGLRKKAQFKELMGDDENCDYEYHKRSRMSRFFWAMTMMDGFLDFIESIKTRADEHRAMPKLRNKIKKSLRDSLPKTLFRPATLLMEISKYSDYVTTEKLSGHPYTTELPKGLMTSIRDSVVEYQGVSYITDTHEGKLLGRPLISAKAGSEVIRPNSPREKILVHLNGAILDIQKTETIEKDELDQW